MDHPGFQFFTLDSSRFTQHIRESVKATLSILYIGFAPLLIASATSLCRSGFQFFTLDSVIQAPNGLLCVQYDFQFFTLDSMEPRARIYKNKIEIVFQFFTLDSEVDVESRESAILDMLTFNSLHWIHCQSGWTNT